MTETGADVAVVGAGPAGAWSAYLLARRGARVVLFDPSHPREKPCGGGVTGRALALVRDVVPLDSLPAVQIRTARFLGRNSQTSATVILDTHRLPHMLVVLSRREFDGRLLSAARGAGVKVVAERVSDVARNGRGFRLQTADGGMHEVRWLVGADGANSLVRRRLTTPFRRDQLSIATGFYAQGATSEEIVIEIVHDPPGYIWSFPRPGHLAIGICAQADQTGAAALRAVTARWISATGIGRGTRLEPYSWPIPSLSAKDFGALDAAGTGWLLVGDAAGLVDPITREGIFFALESAQYAADAIASAAADPTGNYLVRVHEAIGRDLARAARLKAGFFRPQFTDLMVDALARSEGIRRVMAELVAGEQGYRGLGWRLAKTMEIGVGWELLRLRSLKSEVSSLKSQV